MATLPGRPIPEAPVRVALELRARADRSHHRQLLLLEGDADWGRTTAQAIATAIPDAKTQWIGSASRQGALPPSKAALLLGGECGLLVIDAHAGFDPDSLGAAGGTLRSGGLLILLTPELSVWPTITDPEAERIAVFPYRAADVGGRFLARMARLLAASPAVVRLGQNRPSPNAPESSDWDWSDWESSDWTSPHSRNDPRPRALLPAAPANDDQEQVIGAVLKVARGRARRPLVLSADRGRGKSAALGIAAARLAADANRRIIVTAPRRSAARAIFEHARAVDPDAAHRLRFVAPDALLTEQPDSDLLLVDEAAAIPSPLLQRLLAQHGRVVFSTTIHGYEGTGRGFELRFRDVLDRMTPGWRDMRLAKPIRWAADDPLERLIHHALLLDAEPAADDQIAEALHRSPDAPTTDQSVFETLDRDRLGADEQLLRQVFGLLVLGHYQTRPADLRHMLDGPNIGVSVLRNGDTLLATALTAREGALPNQLLAPIFEGRRRPRGHLLPQTLSAHAGLFDAPRLGFVRILRIAVHPAARGR
ncbi:MAG: GNAT family N-acetyltransferase, partial [Thiohalocapsa sp.]